MISAYCHTYGINGMIFRFANIVGSRSNHGVIIDFINKLRKDPKTLEVLGDGKQSKSYLDVKDCVDSFFFCLANKTERTEVFNIGNEDEIDVISIAKIVSESMKLNDVIVKTTGGVDNGKGWIIVNEQMQTNHYRGTPLLPFAVFTLARFQKWT